MQRDANTAWSAVWEPSLLISSLPVFLSFLVTPLSSPFRGRQAFWAGLMLTQLSAFLNALLGGTKTQPLSYFVAFYFPAPISLPPCLSSG